MCRQLGPFLKRAFLKCVACGEEGVVHAIRKRF